MSESNQAKHLDEVLNYSTISDSYFTFITAGVGAGKTTWAREVANGEALG